MRYITARGSQPGTPWEVIDTKGKIDGGPECLALCYEERVARRIAQLLRDSEVVPGQRETKS